MERVAHYSIERELGRGGMGVVYAAVDENLGRPVALKVIRAEDLADRQGIGDPISQLVREARLAAQLSHPALVTIYGFERHGDQALIAMELLHGRTLADVLRDGRLFSAEQAVRVIAGIADGIAIVHDAGIVHRDLKPANVMMLPSGAVKVMDFGVAVSGGERTADGQLAGTPGYMSPEQFRSVNVTTASDVYALAAMVLEMVMGLRPFAGAEAMAVATLSRQGLPPELQQAGPNRARLGALLPVLRAALDPDPARRPADARQFALLLRGAVASGPPVRESATAGRTRPSTSRKRKTVFATAAVTALLIIVIAVATSASLLPRRPMRAAGGAADASAGAPAIGVVAEPASPFQSPVPARKGASDEKALRVAVAGIQPAVQGQAKKTEADLIQERTQLPASMAVAGIVAAELKSLRETKATRDASASSSESGTGELHFEWSSAVNNAQVYIDNRLYEQSPPFAASLPAGRHDVKMVVEGRVILDQSVRVIANETIEVTRLVPPEQH